MTLEKGVATKEDIDKTLKLGMAHPMGPLQLGEWESAGCGAEPAYSLTVIFLS